MKGLDDIFARLLTLYRIMTILKLTFSEQLLVSD